VDDELNVIEAKGRDYGVIKRPMSKGNWNAYGRPKYFADEIQPAAQAPAELPYKVKVTASVLNIRKGAGTNYGQNGSIRDKGVYTIVEESPGKGSTAGWGKLKSGAGWINLSELETNPPVMAGFGSEKMLKSPHHLAVVDDSEYMEYLVFDATQTLTDVRLTMLLPDETGYTQDSILHTLPELVPGSLPSFLLLLHLLPACSLLRRPIR